MTFSWQNLSKALAVGAVCTLSLTACQKADNAGSGTQADSKAPNNAEPTVLRVGTEGAYKPFNYKNANGELAGFDVDIANALCADMQIKCEIVAQDWDGSIPALNAKKFDALVSAMSITPERSAQVDFTEPYFTNSLVFLAKKYSDFDPSKPENINGKNISAQRSTISAQWLEANYPKATAKVYDTLDNAFLDLGAGRVDAMISDKAPALAWLKSADGANFTVKGNEIDINDKLAIAVRKNDIWQAKINTALANIRQNGTYDKIVSQHFGQVATATATASTASTAQ